MRDLLSKGDSSVQLQEELRSIPVEDRLKLMREADFMIDIPPDQGLAMKADLCLPWHKLRLMRR